MEELFAVALNSPETGTGLQELAAVQGVCCTSIYSDLPRGFVFVAIGSDTATAARLLMYDMTSMSATIAP
jgi:hypothetical protein